MKEHEIKLTFSAGTFARQETPDSVFEHCLEYVNSVNGVKYINDSKATSVSETWNALSCMQEKIVLIIGGMDRRSDYSMLTGLVREKVSAIICLGSERSKVFSTLMHKGLIVHAQTLDEAVQCAAILAKPGSTVLFSPGCPSFDAFGNYKDRGTKFKELVNTLLSANA